MDSDDVLLMTESLAKAVDSAADGDGRSAVVEFGWHDFLDDDPETAVRVLATLQGRHLTTFSFLDDVMLAVAEADLDGARTVLLPNGASAFAGRVIGDRVTLSGVGRSDGGRFLAPVEDAAGRLALAAVDLPAADGPAGIDPGSGWRHVDADVPVRDISLLSGDAALPVWNRMQAAGRRELAHELVALGSAMLEMTVDHVTTREQFGRPLATLQVVKHKLADVRLWQECASVAAQAAWEDRGAEASALAKALACRFSRVARENCQQLLGGMGFTWEHAFHRYLRRALVLEPLLGSAPALRAELGRSVRAGTMPALAAL